MPARTYLWPGAGTGYFNRVGHIRSLRGYPRRWTMVGVSAPRSGSLEAPSTNVSSTQGANILTKALRKLNFDSWKLDGLRSAFSSRGGALQHSGRPENSHEPRGPGLNIGFAWYLLQYLLQLIDFSALNVSGLGPARRLYTATRRSGQCGIILKLVWTSRLTSVDVSGVLL